MISDRRSATWNMSVQSAELKLQDVFMDAIEVTPQEVAEALERMKTDPKYGRFF